MLSVPYVYQKLSLQEQKAAHACTLAVFLHSAEIAANKRGSTPRVWTSQ